MKKTMDKLIKSISEGLDAYHYTHSDLAEMLVKEGWVVLDKPKEYWDVVSYEGGGFISRWDNFEDANNATCLTSCTSKVIHLKEVCDE